MRLWSIWNLFSSFLYFIGFFIGLVFFCLLFYLFMPLPFAILFGICVGSGLILGVYGNIKNDRQKKIDAELQDMASGGHRSKRL